MDVTATALDEIEAVLDGALDYGGAEHAREVRDRFKRLFDVLDRGIGLGSPAPNSGCRTTSASSRPNPTPS